MRQIGKAESQITLDDDYNVPDYRPDIIKIINEQGELRFDETKAVSGAVWVKGRLIFRILYRSDQENGKISCLKGELPFQEKINMDGLSEYDPVHLMGEIEDLTVGVIHSRKLNIRAVVVLKALSEGISVKEVSEGLLGDENCMQLKKEIEVSQLLLAKHDICRQKNEILLPSSKPNIREILWKSVELRNIGSRLESDGLHLTGEILLSILYQEEEELDRVQWYETTLPLDCETDIGIEQIGNQMDLFYKVFISDVGKELEVKQDYDGEERMLVLDLQLHLYIRVWQEMKHLMLQDVYSLKQNLIPKKEEISFESLLMKNDAVCKVTAQMTLEENQEKILQICSCEGKAHIEELEQRQDGIYVEGMLEVELIYITTDDQMPVSAIRQLYPFEQMIELPKTESKIRIEQECSVVQLLAAMQDQTHAEIKALIGINILAFAKGEEEHIVEVREELLNIEELQKLPGLVGYIAKKGDTLWEVAKKYHTTMDAIMETNRKKEENLQAGEKLLIVKSV